MSWIGDGSIWQGADMWAAPVESTGYITGLYRRACSHADDVVAALDLDARELIDGKGGPDQDGFDAATWREYTAQIQAAADTFS